MQNVTSWLICSSALLVMVPKTCPAKEKNNPPKLLVGDCRSEVPRQVWDQRVTPPYIPVFLPKWDKGISGVLGCSWEGYSLLLSVIWAAQLCHSSCSPSDGRVTRLSFDSGGRKKRKKLRGLALLCFFCSEQGKPRKSWVSWMNKFTQSRMETAAL